MKKTRKKKGPSALPKYRSGIPEKIERKSNVVNIRGTPDTKKGGRGGRKAKCSGKISIQRHLKPPTAGPATETR